MTCEEKAIDKITLEEIKAVAGKNVKPEVWEWINGGTETELTLQHNHLALEKIFLGLKVLHGLETANTTVKILGQTVRTPIIVAPFANILDQLSRPYKKVNVDFDPINPTSNDIDFDYDVSVNGTNYVALPHGLNTKLGDADEVKVRMVWPLAGG